MSKENKDIKKYSRRGILAKLGYGAKVIGGAALYGLAVGLLGKGYEGVRNTVGKIIKPVEYIQRKSIGILGKAREYMPDFYNPFAGKKVIPKEISKEITRRGFFNKLARTVNQYPVASGVVIDAGYG